jgi:hypothetical protein
MLHEHIKLAVAFVIGLSTLSSQYEVQSLPQTLQAFQIPVPIAIYLNTARAPEKSLVLLHQFAPNSDVASTALEKL